MSGRKVELDEVILPSLELESSTSVKTVPVMPTPTREEANDDDHETSNQVTTELRRSRRTRSAPEWYDNPVMEIMLLDNGEPSNYEEAMAGQTPTNGLKPCNPRYGPYMKTKYGLWLTCPMIDKQLRINGSSRRRLTLTVILLSTKLDLSQKVFDKFKGLTTMRPSHP